MKVPVVTGPSVSSDPLRTPELNISAGPGAFGAGIAQGLGQAAGVLGDVGASLKRENDSAAVTKYVGIATDIANERMTGYGQLVLGDAKGVTEKARGEFEKLRADAVSLAENETQKALINETLTKQHVAMLGSVREHEAKQFQADKQASADLLIAKSGDMVIAEPLNYDVAFVAKGQAAAAAAIKAEGLDPAQKTQMQEAAVSGIAAKQLQSLLASNRNADFLVLYPQLKDELKGADAERYAEYAVKTSDAEVEQALSTVAVANNPGDELGAVNQIRKLPIPVPQQDAVIARTKVAYAEIDKAAKQVQSADLDKFGETLNNNGYKVENVPADLYERVNKYNPNAVTAARAHQLALANGTTRKVSDPTVIEAWYSASDAEKRLDPRWNPANLVDKLTASDYEFISKTRGELIRTATGFPSKSAKPTYTEADVAALVSAEFIKAYGSLKPGDSPKRFATFQSLLRQRLDHYQQLNEGKSPPLEGANSISAFVSYALAEGARLDTGQKGRRRFEVLLPSGGGAGLFKPNDPTQPQEDPLDVIATVPDEEEVKIIDALRRAGKPVTASEVLRQYQMKVEKQKRQQF